MQNINYEPIASESKFTGAETIDKAFVEKALQAALEKIDGNLETFRYKFPSHASVNNVYTQDENNEGWNQGFWTGMLWLAYEKTGDVKYRQVAEGQIPSYTKRIVERLGVDHHDMGFLYSLSCVAAYRLTGNEEAKKAALLAADNLLTRYHEKGEFLQAWGQMGDKSDSRLIIDCLMNIPLLYWASEVTGDPRYDEVAYKHFKTTVGSIIREDASTYHTFFFNTETGEPERGVTAQGASDDSCWARGQSWGIYGLPLTLKYKPQDKEIIPQVKCLINYFLNRLPEDFVSAWDLIFTENDSQRDTSAAAIAACGILEAVKHMENSDPLKTLYFSAAQKLLRSLYENYSTKDTPGSNGLLLHAVYSLPHNNGVDECNIWGDYFYMEALMRLYKDWELYW